VFLDSDADYFLSLGGDNPPPRDAVKRLMKLDADVASGICYQRPSQAQAWKEPVFPLVYEYTWKLDELPDDLEDDVRREFETAWLNSTLMVPLHTNPEWLKLETVRGYTGGTGCVLIRRKVLERIGFSLPPLGYHSEDIHFFNKANYRGFTTAWDLKLHVRHLDPDGSAY